MFRFMFCNVCLAEFQITLLEIYDSFDCVALEI